MSPAWLHMAAGFLLALLLSNAAVAGADDSGCVSSACHPEMGKGRFVHAPVLSHDCGSCHLPTGKRHPEEKGAFTLAESGAKLCYMCHEEKGRKKTVHAPVESGDCTGCHDPHQSPYRRQLKEFGAQLCFTCHGGMERMARESRSAHAPFLEGDCRACHDPHSSDFGKLLTSSYPGDYYLSYTSDSYRLCFGCHNIDIANYRRTTVDTGFRNGDINLHYIHVNRVDKGRSCKVCHDPHAAQQYKLVKSSIPGFGKWAVPFKLKLTKTGGTCVVGCHKPQSYDREQAR